MKYSYCLGGGIIFLLGGLSACSDLHTYKLSDGTVSPAAAPLTGQMTYFLPRTVINATISLSVTRCDGVSIASTDPSAPALPDKPIIVTASLTPTSSLQPDPAYGYAIDYRGDQTWIKEIQITLNTTPTKIFTSINDQINDQAGPIAVAAVTAAVQIAGAAFLPGVAPVHPGRNTEYSGGIGLEPKQVVCGRDVKNAMDGVAADQAQIQKLKAKIAAYYQKLATASALPGKNDPTIQWSQAQTAIQADMSKRQAMLTHTYTVTWSPEYKDFKMKKNSLGEPIWLAVHQIPISHWVEKFLSNPTLFDGNSSEDIAEANKPDEKSLRQPLFLVIAADPASVFDKRSFDTQHPNSDPLGNPKPDGLLIRDPAVGIMQLCTPKDNTESLTQTTAGQWGYNPTVLFKLCPPPSVLQTTQSEGAKKTDDSTRVPISLPQLGRPLLMTAHSGLWENATLGVTMNTDGSISQITTHDLSTAATSLGGVATAAGDAASAETARNNAITAGNTALTTKLTLPDTINKGTADCYTQAATIMKAGGTPIPCQ